MSHTGFLELLIFKMLIFKELPYRTSRCVATSTPPVQCTEYLSTEVETLLS